MKKPERFCLYRADPRHWRFQIGSANDVGFVVGLINVLVFMYGYDEMAGGTGFVSPTAGACIFFCALSFWIFSLIYLTDRSRPYDKT